MATSELLKRTASGISMLLVLFINIIYLGDYALLFLIFVIQGKAFKELKEIGSTPHVGTTQIKVVDWLLFLLVNNTVLSTILYPNENYPLIFPFIGYVLVTAFWIIFVLNKHKDSLQERIMHYSWVHLVLLFTAPQTLFISFNLKLGLFWFIFPCLNVIVNDVSAYFIGRSFGKHHLISLSPKKTIEGFLGAAVTTISIGYLLTLVLSSHESLFTNTNQMIHRDIGYHGFVIAVCASFLAPLGDLVSSAFKRAGKVKDYDDIIPGHGGISDRMDGHLFMAAFTYLYYQWISH